jgi:hypothetical protein
MKSSVTSANIHLNSLPLKVLFHVIISYSPSCSQMMYIIYSLFFSLRNIKGKQYERNKKCVLLHVTVFIVGKHLIIVYFLSLVYLVFCTIMKKKKYKYYLIECHYI